MAWYVRHKDFDFETLFAAKGLVKCDRLAGGVYVECFHDNHSGGDSETFLVNGDGERGFVLHCSGASGGCPEITDRLVRFAKYIEADRIAIEDLEDTEYGGGPVPFLKPTKDAIREAIDKLDKNSTSDDWDAVVELVARFGDESFDAEALELICKRTGKQIKGALRSKIKELRKKSSRDDRAQAEEASFSSDTRMLFDNWDMKGEAFADTCQTVIDTLVEANTTPPKLFAMGQGPSRLTCHSLTGQLAPEALDYASMRNEIAQVTRFGRTKKNRHGEEYFQDLPVPEAIAQHVINTPNIPLPVLIGATDTPYFDRDGKLVMEPGYNAASKMFYRPPASFVLDAIPLEPTDVEIEAARSILLEAVCDSF